jgi:hypothetical protein
LVKITVLERHNLDCGHFELILPSTPFGKEVVSIIISDGNKNFEPDNYGNCNFYKTMQITNEEV